MGRTTQRLIIAAILSVTLYTLTVYWYKSTSKRNENQSSSKPLAYVSEVYDEVQRKPLSKTIWQMLEMGEPIYPGEAIKTSEKSEVRIQFADSERYINIEPESMVVLSQSQNEISLDLMDGSLFVSQGEKGDEKDKKDTGQQALTLKSEKGKIDLTKATAALSKSSNKDIQLQVIKGKAQVENNGKIQQIESGKSSSINKQGLATESNINIKIISPEIDKPTYVNPDNLEPIRFAWEGTPKGSKVILQLGTQRKELKEIPTQVGSQDRELKMSIQPGKYYWKLIAKQDKEQKNIESPIYRLVIEPRYAPVPVYPGPNDQIESEKASAKLSLKWTLPDPMKSVYVELSKEANLKSKLFSKNFIDEDQTIQNLEKGDYYWRLSTQYPGIPKTFSSKIYKFSIVEKKAKPLPKVTIQWKNQELIEKQSFIKDPRISLDWNSEQKEQIHHWKVKIAQSEDEIKNKTPQIEKETNLINFMTTIEKPGRYIAQVDGFDKNNTYLASSNFKTIDIQSVPLLPAVDFLPTEGDLATDDSGFLNLSWTAVSGAQKYFITLYSKDGTKISSKNYQGTKTTINNLLPGSYKVDVVAIDEHGREGEKKKARIIQVPELSGIKAPKIKGVKIK